MRQTKTMIVSLLILVAMFFATQAVKSYQTESKISELKALAGAGFQQKEATKNDDCVSQHNQSDPECTPGAILPDVVRGDVCKRGYASTVKSVTAKTREQIFRVYGIPEEHRNEFAVDHLVSINLGGSSETANLWPQLKSDSTAKNKVESLLLNETCAGRLTLSEAQEIISRHWQAVRP